MNYIAMLTMGHLRQDLSKKTQAGRTFAAEFAELQKIFGDLELEIDLALKADPEFSKLVESGIRAIPRFQPAILDDAFGETPVGILEYEVKMPDCPGTRINRKLDVCLSFAGDPIFRMNDRQYTRAEAVLIMTAAIKYLRTK